MEAVKPPNLLLSLPPVPSVGLSHGTHCRGNLNSFHYSTKPNQPSRQTEPFANCGRSYSNSYPLFTILAATPTDDAKQALWQAPTKMHSDLLHATPVYRGTSSTRSSRMKSIALWINRSAPIGKAPTTCCYNSWIAVVRSAVCDGIQVSRFTRVLRKAIFFAWSAELSCITACCS